jgi:hypothetical protein
MRILIAFAAIGATLFMFPGFWLQVFIALVSVGDLMVAAPFPFVVFAGCAFLLVRALKR